ncbi:MAG: SET domain-containing protein-lysine N-methyltransferase [Burkholderiales bacterium]|nr:SET domain-containing protein-lysine N-methyltransferase [Burkholderiales bacterium]MBK8667433.1 SET domain-containing protein-lysine N-methyltransferase [Burkholderiales bacterium]
MPPKTPTTAPATPGRRIQVRRSGVHGKGVFALVDIPRGERIIEYTGELISWDEAQRRHPHDPQDPNHTFYFHIDDQHVIDALYGGNASRWINHSCAPNCEADEDEGRIFIKSRRKIRAGEELNYDYGLVIDEPLTPELKAEYPCWCHSKTCRGTLLSSDLDTAEGREKKKKKKQAKA